MHDLDAMNVPGRAHMMGKSLAMHVPFADAATKHSGDRRFRRARANKSVDLRGGDLKTFAVQDVLNVKKKRRRH